MELVPQFGALLEDVCPACKGRFLGPAAVERVIVDELGLSSQLLREMTALFSSKTRLPCPACASKLSPLQLRKVRIDLCTGCGGAWLDGGELTLLGEGRHEELTPVLAASSTSSTSSTSPAPAQRGEVHNSKPAQRGDVPASHWQSDAPIVGTLEPGRFIVFFNDPSRVTREALTAAFTNVPGLASADAAQIVARQRCTAVEGATEQHAQRVVETLALAGIEAHVADESWLSLPQAISTNGLAVDERGIALGRPSDPGRRSLVEEASRVEVPWSSVAAMATGQIVRSSMKRTLSARQTQERHNEPEFDLAIVEAADVCLEVVLSAPARRYRLLLSTMIFGVASAEGARPRRALLDERLAEVVRLAPALLPLGRGVTARGAALPRYGSMKDLERELGWLLWRRHR